MVDLRYPLTEALLDEYLARATYHQVLRKFGQRLPFSRIIEAEQRHVEALLVLFTRYQIPVPADPFANQVSVPDQFPACCQQGIAGELRNIALYDRLLSQPLPTDVQYTFVQLQQASRWHHLPAFSRCAERSTNPLLERTAPGKKTALWLGLASGAALVLAINRWRSR